MHYVEQLEDIKNYLSQRTSIRPKVGIICGTGLGFLAKEIESSVSFPYEEIPHFPECTTKGHLGNLVFGYVNSIPVMCVQGRFHLFEGYSPQQCAIPIRIMKMMGASHVLISNSAGGINPNFKVGNIMIIKDHVNFVGMSGFNPLRGPNLENFGPRFPPMNEAYNKDLIEYAHKVAAEKGFDNNICEGYMRVLVDRVTKLWPKSTCLRR
ncbi:hypothetical protein FQR65_LT08273 [Abscondita terminalis]|nr:hypothetical protein FQR65_LT08273 [Abscondita terminalis]